jgi:hypothetical protein
MRLQEKCSCIRQNADAPRKTALPSRIAQVFTLRIFAVASRLVVSGFLETLFAVTPCINPASSVADYRGVQKTFARHPPRRRDLRSRPGTPAVACFGLLWQDPANFRPPPSCGLSEFGRFCPHLERFRHPSRRGRVWPHLAASRKQRCSAPDSRSRFIVKIFIFFRAPPL